MLRTTQLSDKALMADSHLNGMWDVALIMKAFFARIWKTFVFCVQRNQTILKVTALTFSGVVIASMLLAVLSFSVAPWLLEFLRSIMESERSYIAIPPPYTENLYLFILSNNAGHFWNPLRMLVWVPLFGTLVLGLELLLNGVVIGVVSVMVGMTRGISYPILGLVPHGVFEIPAFIFQFASIIRWHISIVEILMAKIIGEKTNGDRFKRGAKDAVILAVVSLMLFVVAAFIETYVTPRLLGM